MRTNIKNRIFEIGHANNGYILRRDLYRNDIPSIYLTRMCNDGTVSKICSGVYFLNGYAEDTFFNIFARYRKAVFTGESALYLQELTNRQLSRIEVNFPNYYKLNRDPGFKYYRTNKLHYELGKCEVLSPCGNTIWTYDKERCICDMFVWDEHDYEERSHAVHQYKHFGIDYDKLYSYADALGVLVPIKSIFEVI